MKSAYDFRTIARDSLKGNWGITILAGLIASLLGATSSGSVTLSFTGNSESSGSFSEILGELSPIASSLIISIATFTAIAALIFTIVRFILGSIVGAGYAKFNLNLVDRQQPTVLDALFSYFKHWKTLCVANLLIGLYTFLWMLLCFIPGIVASYSYAMTRFILAEDPELPASEAISRSKEMMQGNRWRLFCLEMSFFGWALLCVFTCGIGLLWLTPYQQAAYAAFYREVSGTEQIITPSEPLLIDNNP